MTGSTEPALVSRVYSLTTWFLVALAIGVFLPAWSLRYWQGAIYWLLFAGWPFFLNGYFLKHDPALVERRTKAGPRDEPRRAQQIIQGVTSALLVALFVGSALDYRFQWSGRVPAIVSVAADAVVSLGFLLIFRVFIANSYTSGIVEVTAGQRVISTGPYAAVRHPMYSGAALLFLATPPALGSYWGIVDGVLLIVAMGARAVDEERLLRDQLPGYAEYMQRVRARLVPGVW